MIDGKRGRFRGFVTTVAASLVTLAAVLAPAALAAPNGVIAFGVGSGTLTSFATVRANGTSRFPVTGVPAASAGVAWAAGATRLAFSSPVAGIDQIFTMNTDGTQLRQLTHDPVGASDPTWSPDGSEIAYASSGDGLPAIAIVDLQSGSTSQVTSDTGFSDGQPQWSPDGTLVAFSSDRTGSDEITTIAPDGSNETTITTEPGANSDPSWSPDGSQIAYTNSDGTVSRIDAAASGGGTWRQLTLGGSDGSPSWSPDGTRIAFSRGRDLYVVAASGETIDAPAAFVTRDATDAAWGPAPTTLVVPITGTSTTGRGAKQRTVTTPQAVTVGTTVNSTTGTSRVVFKPLTTPLATPSAVTTVHGGTYTVATQTADQMTLQVAGLVCTHGSGAARAASLNRNGAGFTRVRVRGGHFKLLSGHVTAGSRDPPNFTLTATCNGTTIRVTQGHVRVTITSTRTSGRRGRSRSVRYHRVSRGSRSGSGGSVGGGRTQTIDLRGGQGLVITGGS